MDPMQIHLQYWARAGPADEEEFLALVYLKVVTYSVLSFNKNRSLKPKYNKKAIILFFSEIELIKKTYRLKPHCIVKKS